MSIHSQPANEAASDPGPAGSVPERWGGSVRAHAPELALVRFAWIDEVSGERLIVDVEGSEDFFLALEEQGFERVTEERPPLDAGAPDLRIDGDAQSHSARRERGTRRTPA